jgi:hypothetical protein
MSSGVGGKEQCGHGPVRKRVGEQGKHGGLSAWGTVNLARQAAISGSSVHHTAACLRVMAMHGINNKLSEEKPLHHPYNPERPTKKYNIFYPPTRCGTGAL